jgi:hypothetical protein
MSTLMLGRRAILALLDRALGASDEIFVEAAYRVVLGRPADPGALANCLERLRRGEARVLLVQDLVASEEFAARARSRGEELDRRDYDIRGVPLTLYDVPGYPMRDVVVGELLADVYGLDGIDFAPGDVMIDVGANLGIVSAYVARRFPGVAVYAYEPVPDSFRILERNLEANGAAGVRPFPLAVIAGRSSCSRGATSSAAPRRTTSRSASRAPAICASGRRR